MTIPAPLQLWRESVRDQWTDYNGHMNLAYYVLIFDHATDVFYDYVGLGEAYRERTNHSTFAVEAHVTYDRELLADETARVATRLLDFDEKRIHYFHEMYDAVTGALASTTELMAVHIDLGPRKVVPMPASVLDRLAEVKSAHAALPRPDQVGRIIGIRRKA